MSTFKILGLMALFLLVAASPVFAQGTGSGVGTGELRFVGAALGMGIASGLCGLGQGKSVAGADEAGDPARRRVAGSEVREDDEERDDERRVEDPDVDGRRPDRGIGEPGDDQEPAADDDRDPEADRLRQRERLREAAFGRYPFISVAIT